MKRRSLSTIGLLAGLLAGIILWNLPLQGILPDAQKCLALSLTVIVWWATKALPVGYASLALLMGYVLFLGREAAPLSVIFNLWTTPTIYLVVGGFLIAQAVQSSGLGKRVALLFVQRIVHSYRGVIISCYALGAALSLIIPHPWPRSFLIMSVMGHVIKAAKLDKKYAANIGLAIFAGSIPTAMILLTGDSTLNPTVADFAGTSISWLQWLIYMGLPGVLASALTCAAQLKLFGAPQSFQLDSEYVNQQLSELGGISRKETICALVLAAAVLTWITDSVHGIHPGWVAILAVIVLSLPALELLDNASWTSVNMGTLFFLCAALSIGTVGRVTGMNEWVVNLLLPNQVSANPYVFAMIACVLCMIVHVVLGSTLAVLSIVTPAIISFGGMAGLPPLVCALVAYTAVALHWVLPFHHMNLLVGVGEENGGFTDREVLKMCIPQTVIVLGICLFEVFWWQLLRLV